MGNGAGRVVVVDDDADFREVVVQLLSDAGFTAVGAADGREALAVARRLAPALIVLDLEMPGMSGWEFRCAQLRDPALAAIPVVVASSADPGTLEADGYLAKPYTGTELLRVIAALGVGADASIAA